jgi:catechol 2,3-dioxygenase-like lactoylglutathione lyase family enzyme
VSDEPLRPHGFHHHALKVRDLARSEAFYVGVLGLEIERRWLYPAESTRQGLRAVWLRTIPGSAEGFLALEQLEGETARDGASSAGHGSPQGGPSDLAGHFLFALRIALADRERWRARLAGAGYPVTHETAFTLYVADPEGNRLGLSHHPEPAATFAQLR